MKVNTRRAAFEFMSIVVAVILAMTLTEWRQDYLNRKLAKKSFSNIVEEIKENLEELRGDSARIAQDLKFMSDWVKNKAKGEPSEGFQANFRFSILSNAAYEVAKVNESPTHFTNEQNMDIAGIYALQDLYNEKGSELFSIMGEIQGTVRDQDSDEFFKVVQRMRYHEGLIYNIIGGYIQGCEEFLELYPGSSL